MGNSEENLTKLTKFLFAFSKYMLAKKWHKNKQYKKCTKILKKY